MPSGIAETVRYSINAVGLTMPFQALLRQLEWTPIIWSTDRLLTICKEAADLIRHTEQEQIWAEQTAIATVAHHFSVPIVVANVWAET